MVEWKGWRRLFFERLDRMLVNQQLQAQFGCTEVKHLARTGSNHAPMLCSFDAQAQNFIKPFRFSHFWTEHAVFFRSD